jgi:hypothetical protein
LEKGRAQIDQWIAEEQPPIREVELQQRLDIGPRSSRKSTRQPDCPSWTKRW